MFKWHYITIVKHLVLRQFFHVNRVLPIRISSYQLRVLYLVLLSFASSHSPNRIYLKVQVRSKVDGIGVLLRVDASTILLFLVSLVEDPVHHGIIIFLTVLLHFLLIIVLMHLRLLSLEISL